MPGTTQEQSTRHLEPRQEQLVQPPRLLEQPMEQRRPIDPLTNRPARLPHNQERASKRTQRRRNSRQLSRLIRHHQQEGTLHMLGKGMQRRASTLLSSQPSLRH